jgi:hypothetical protein
MLLLLVLAEDEDDGDDAAAEATPIANHLQDSDRKTVMKVIRKDDIVFVLIAASWVAHCWALDWLLFVDCVRVIA